MTEHKETILSCNHFVFFLSKKPSKKYKNCIKSLNLFDKFKNLHVQLAYCQWFMHRCQKIRSEVSAFSIRCYCSVAYFKLKIWNSDYQWCSDNLYSKLKYMYRRKKEVKNLWFYLSVRKKKVGKKFFLQISSRKTGTVYLDRWILYLRFRW